MRGTQPYDVIVVGSGAGGGMSAFELTRAGLKVLMLEAGRDYDPASETPMFNIPADAPLRAAPTPDKPGGYFDATVDGGWEVPDEPYTVAPGSDFKWWRPRMLGGRTNHWGQIALRYGPYDFKPYSRDGLGYDWPVSYEDIAPWYDRVERLIGVTGGAPMGLENTPDSPPGTLMAVPPMRASEVFVARGLSSMGIPVAPMRASVLTEPKDDRFACFYATSCSRGCSIRASFQSTTVLIPPALATGNLDVQTHALVYEVIVGADGRATGVSFVDRHTGMHHTAKARSVVLAAGAGETARILLNSKSTLFPDGIGNDYGLAGKYLMDSVGSATVAQFPALEGLPPAHEDGIANGHIYVPWWGYELQRKRLLDFPRGYHIELMGGRIMPSMNWMGLFDLGEREFGAELRNKVHRQYGSHFIFEGRGEMIPNDDSYCELDPDVRDKWGIPVLRFHWKWGEHELRQASHMRRTFHELIDLLGGNIVFGTETDGAAAISRGGEMIHEVGTARMGDAPQTSVVNEYGQIWAVPNLFIADGAVLSSKSDKNPTLTILALAARTSVNLAEQARKGAL